MKIFFLILTLDLDSNNEEDDDDNDGDDEDDNTPIPQISHESHLSEDSSENFRLQKAG